ncbi:MAG TPA: cytochrome P450 [Solirubrobacteraceae bacterium]|nr:cytochrome P450 [Solirubrobacteraceae bacterium]HME04037.1 cytochrome P450 [Solirubrobacteraceae bacterium]
MGIPVVDADLYAENVLVDSRDLYARIREAGSIVWLPRQKMYAMGRFADVRAALRDDDLFLSGRGVAANPIANRLGTDTTLNSDGETHATRRRVLMKSLGAKALAAIEEPLAREARAAVEALVCRERFEVARDFASHLPVSVVSELVGVRGGSERMLRWAAATFDGLGPLNRRGFRSMPRALSLFLYSLKLRRRAVPPGTWAASVFDAQRRGELSAREARALVIDLVAPALDTTILATTHLVWVLAQNRNAWAQIRNDPRLIPAAVVENVRLASPIRGFTRTLAREHAIDGVTLPEGSRVVMLFAAANLDGSQFPEPERFNLERPNGAHLGWGNGAHTCVGIHLAKLEMQMLLEAMVSRVDSIWAGKPTPLRNNTLQGIARLPAQFS